MIALMPLLMIRIPSVRDKQAHQSSFSEDLKEGFAFVKSARGFLPLLVLATALNFLLTPFSTLLPYFVKFDHLGNAADLALVMALFQAGILAGGLLMSVIRGFKRKMVATAVSIYIIFLGYAIAALTPMGLFWFMAVGGLVMAFCVPVANVSTQTIIQTIVPLKMQGRVNSVTMAMASAATPFGMILSGLVVEFTRTVNLFLACVILGVMILTLSWVLTDIRYVDKVEKPHTTQIS